MNLSLTPPQPINKLKNKKEKLIDAIKAKIKNIGVFYIGENGFDSPIYKIHSKDNETLIESICYNYVNVIEYLHGIEIEKYSVSHEELTIFQLKLLVEMLNEKCE